jgi:hypothetical protein
MADIAPIPFINFGESQARQAQGQAQAGLANQEAQKTSLDNQFSAAALPYMMHALHDYSDGGAPPAQANDHDAAYSDSSGVSSVPGYGGGDPNSDSNLRLRNTVVPFMPGEQQRLGQAALLSGKMPGLLQMAQFQRDQRIALQTQQNQVRSGNLFDGMRSVVDADPGSAMSTLAATNMAPGTVQMLAKQFGDDKEGADNAAREYARHVAGASHQYSGREVEQRTDGNYYDKVSGFQVPGAGHVGMNDEQWATLASKGMELVDVPTGDGDSTKKVPRYKADNPNGTLDNWVMQAAAARGAANAHPSVTGAPHIEAKNNATAASQSAQQSATPQQKEVNAAGKHGVYNDANGNPDPTLTKAMNDDSYDINIPKYGYGTKPPSEVVQARQQAAKDAASLSKDSGDTINAQRAALVMYKAAQDTINKGHFDGGAWSSELAKVARWLPPGFQQALGAGDYQMLSKYLGQAALQSGKGIFQKMTQMEAKWLKDELNPSPGMTPDSLRSLIDMNVKQSQYIIDSAGRANKYVGKDQAHPLKDPNKFSAWNQQYFPMQSIVSESNAATPNQEAQAKTAWGAYEPDKYEYRTSNGKLQRRAKQ